MFHVISLYRRALWAALNRAWADAARGAAAETQATLM